MKSYLLAGGVCLGLALSVYAERWTLIDFGTNDATTQMAYPAWTNLLRHPTRTQYVNPDGNPDHGGLTETGGIPAGQWAYYGVSGSSPIAFQTGHTIVATLILRPLHHWLSI